MLWEIDVMGEEQTLGSTTDLLGIESHLATQKTCDQSVHHISLRCVLFVFMTFYLAYLYIARQLFYA